MVLKAILITSFGKGKLQDRHPGEGWTSFSTAKLIIQCPGEALNFQPRRQQAIPAFAGMTTVKFRRSRAA
jgi:hypothetical protein